MSTVSVKKCLSGAAKKKKKSEQEEAAKKQKTALSAWLLNAQNDSDERQIPAINPTEDVDQSNCDVGRAINNHQNIVTTENSTLDETENIQTVKDCELRIPTDENSSDSDNEEYLGESQPVSVAHEPIKEKVLISDDPDIWPIPMTDKFRMSLVEKGPQQHPGPFPKAATGRSFSLPYYTRELPNREVIKRQWLTYSSSKDCVFCFACLLFGHTNRFTTGYCNWQKLSEKLKDHETQPSHLKSYVKWKESVSRLRKNKTIDSTIQTMIAAEKERWRGVLKCVMDCVLFLAERNLAFRGTKEEHGSRSNGNFLGLMDLLGKHCYIIADHIRRAVDAEKKVGSYLTWEHQNEFINLIATSVLKEIIRRVLTAKYFSIQLDCTPDISHIEQTTIVVRYVQIDEATKVAKIMENFLGFVDVTDTTGEGLAEVLCTKLADMKLDVLDCRRQGYDNGSNMSGRKQGVQARIRQVNPLALYVPCASHNWNLLFADAASSCLLCKNFFGILQRLYTLFAASTKRWDVLKKHVKMTLKGLSETRWEARVNAVEAVRFQMKEICDALDELGDLTSGAGAADSNLYSEVISLQHQIQTMKFITSVVVWYEILLKVKKISKLSQCVQMSIDVAVQLVNTIRSFLTEYRSSGFNSAVVVAKSIAQDLEICAEFPKERLRKKKHFFDEQCKDEIGNVQQNSPEKVFEIDFFFPMVDTLLLQLQSRFEGMHNVQTMFKCILQIRTLTDEELEAACTEFTNFTTDVSADLFEEIKLLKEILPLGTAIGKDLQPLIVLNYLLDQGLEELFPNVITAIRLFLTLPVTVASSERSFSKLKLIKTYLRSTMSQERLSSLAMLSIESQIAHECNFEDLIDEWASQKARRLAKV